MLLLFTFDGFILCTVGSTTVRKMYDRPVGWDRQWKEFEPSSRFELNPGLLT
jgi:hypothetical protein